MLPPYRARRRRFERTAERSGRSSNAEPCAQVARSAVAQIEILAERGGEGSNQGRTGLSTLALLRSGRSSEPGDRAIVLPRMLRAADDVGEGEPGQQIGDRPLTVDHTEARLDEPFQVDPPPPHDAVDNRIGTVSTILANSAI